MTDDDDEGMSTGERSLREGDGEVARSEQLQGRL